MQIVIDITPEAMEDIKNDRASRCFLQNKILNGKSLPKGDEAIKAIEQQPCEDCISRKEVNVLVDELARAISDERCFISRGRSTANIMQDILDLPSVTPKYTDEEIDKAQAVEQAYVDKMVELAVEETKRPTARWEKYVDDYIKCSKCGRIVKFYHYNYKYCPHCGARMIESEGEDDRD